MASKLRTAVPESAPESQAVPAAVAVEQTTLREWCANTSATDRRVELLGAFFTLETRDGRVKADPDVFAARYAKFVNRPV